MSHFIGWFFLLFLKHFAMMWQINFHKSSITVLTFCPCTPDTWIGLDSGICCTWQQMNLISSQTGIGCFSALFSLVTEGLAQRDRMLNMVENIGIGNIWVRENSVDELLTLQKWSLQQHAEICCLVKGSPVSKISLWQGNHVCNRIRYIWCWLVNVPKPCQEDVSCFLQPA